MKITAILCVRNEAKYLRTTLDHLVKNGIQIALIDNDSNDESKSIFEFYEDSIVSMTTLPYKGYFSLSEQLEEKSKVIDLTESDWFIHIDADEIMESPKDNESLRSGIERANREGFTAINFDEFVFIPEKDKSYEYKNFYTLMRWYYFFEPRPKRLLRAWKARQGLRQAAGGHHLNGNFKLFPKNFILRHYPVLSQSHANLKYPQRKFSPTDLKNGWHGNRVNVNETDMTLPSQNISKK